MSGIVIIGVASFTVWWFYFRKHYVPLPKDTSHRINKNEVRKLDKKPPTVPVEIPVNDMRYSRKI